MRKLIQIILFFISWNALSQKDSIPNNSDYFLVKYAVSDTIVFHNTGVNPHLFQVFVVSEKDTIPLTLLNITKNVLSQTYYEVDFSLARLTLTPAFYQRYPEIWNVAISYKTYPDFLTKTYMSYDESQIFQNFNGNISVGEEKKQIHRKPFEGLETQGNLIRGITIGNNQDAVLNSILDLKIAGKLSSNVNLSAHINDTNIPIQENGYSQELKDIDRIYIELSGTQWNIKAGDIMLQDSTHHFLNFTKKVQGVSLGIETENIDLFSSGALVKGKYANFQFQGMEANQGPYKLQGKNGELYIFIIGGSEKVYIDGILQIRGENRDYVMDYNTGEIIFTPTNPIHSDKRISIEYQYIDRNYSRFLTYNTAKYHSKKWHLGMAFYRESDLKNQTMALDLSEEQKLLLANAGNNSHQIYVVQAIQTEYDLNKILYQKINIGGTEVFEYSTDEMQILYEVSFTYFGPNAGDYKVLEYVTTGKKMGYVGENQGDYKAVIPLSAPNSQQYWVLNSQYKPSEKTNLEAELAYSNLNNNLFANKVSTALNAPALKTRWEQTLWNKKWKIASLIQFDFLQAHFTSLERVFHVEFDRDWNIQTKTGNQSLLNGKITFQKTDKTKLFYQFENLRFGDVYHGNKHNIGGDFGSSKWQFHQWNSFLKSEDSFYNTKFYRNNTFMGFKQKKWFATFDLIWDHNLIKSHADKSIQPLSFQALQERWVFGIGDTTKVYSKIGLQLTQNDSVRLSRLKPVNRSDTWFLQTQLIQKKQVNLLFYANVRNIQYDSGEKINALNSRISYRHQLFNDFFTFHAEYQNTSGQVAQQDYNYIETEPGQGYYTWIDYNENGLKELDEFEVAVFADQAKYLRISLPNISYLPTQAARLTQNFEWNLLKWSKAKGLKRFMSHWYNHLNIDAQTNILRTNHLLNINPFDFKNQNLISDQYQMSNQLVFNRGKSHYTTAFTMSETRKKVWQSFGSVSQNIALYQIYFQHLLEAQWQIELQANIIEDKSFNETYLNRNFNIKTENITPSITHFFNKTHYVKTAFEYADKQNQTANQEHLNIQKIRLEHHYTSSKETRFSIDFNLIKNNFVGNPLSQVGYVMLEGLQIGKNMTWNMLWSKKLNSFLFLNLHYNGRANELSPTIHTGNVQLRAQF